MLSKRLHKTLRFAIDYEMKLKIYFISSFRFTLFEYIVGYVFIVYL